MALRVLALAVLILGVSSEKRLEDHVKEQYDSYPYPPVQFTASHVFAEAVSGMGEWEFHPEMMLVSPSHLAEINHYLFRGRRDFCKPFRVLIAGGGTGFRTFILASQLEDMRSKHYEIVHLDLSSKAIDLAKQRLNTRKALRHANVRFVQGSLLDIGSMDLGLFDYIDCLGVLHHMNEPQRALRLLSTVLAPKGGMGLMLYGELGRRGVYEVRKMLSILDRGLDAQGQLDMSFPARLKRLRALLGDLPSTNWLRLDKWRWQSLEVFAQRAGDVGLVDLFLNPVDVPYNSTGVLELAGSAGLQVVTFLPPCLLDPASYLLNETLLQAVQGLAWKERMAFAELLSGALDDHSFYVTRPLEPDPSSTDHLPTAATHTTARLNNRPHMWYPIPHHFNPATLAQQLRVRNTLEWTYNNQVFDFGPFPELAPQILAHIDGLKSLQQVHRAVQLSSLSSAPEHASSEAGTDNSVVAWDEFLQQFEQLYSILNSVGRMYLSSGPLSLDSTYNINNYYSRSTTSESEANLYNYYTFKRCDAHMQEMRASARGVATGG